MPDQDLQALSTVDLVSALVDDARDLAEVRLETLREDLAKKLAKLGSTLIAIGVFVVTAILLSLAMAASLVALGAPWWLALWIVTVVAAVIGIGFVIRATGHNKKDTPS